LNHILVKNFFQVTGKQYKLQFIAVVILLIFTARRIAGPVLATAIPSVRPSVRHTPVLCQNDGT